MQTYLVHMREPGRLARELGPRRFIGFQMLMSALLFSALLHPWFYIELARQLSGDAHAFRITTVADALVWGIALFNLVAGYLSAILLGRAAMRRRNHAVAGWIWLLPIYWLAISVAAYCALVKLVIAPYHWDKTEHYGTEPEQEQDSTRPHSVGSPGPRSDGIR